MNQNDTERLEKLRKFERELALLAGQYTSEFQEAVALNLTPIELQIFRDAMPLYSAETGRWYDPWGIADSVLDFKYIMQQERVPEREQLLAIAVLFYHDTGYEPREESSAYSGEEQRRKHMEIGAVNADLDLSILCDGLGGRVFTDSEIRRIYDAVLHHDDKYLGGTPFGDSLLQMFVDADNIFIPSFVSAYKDYVARYARPDPEDQREDMIDAIRFLRMRQSCFFEMGEELTFGQRVRITEESNELYKGKKLPIKFDTTKRVIAAHMLARTNEFENLSFCHAYFGDWGRFRPFAEDYFQGSIRLARQGQSYDVQRFGDKV